MPPHLAQLLCRRQTKKFGMSRMSLENILRRRFKGHSTYMLWTVFILLILGALLGGGGGGGRQCGLNTFVPPVKIKNKNLLQNASGFSRVRFQIPFVPLLNQNTVGIQIVADKAIDLTIWQPNFQNGCHLLGFKMVGLFGIQIPRSRSRARSRLSNNVFWVGWI